MGARIAAISAFPKWQAVRNALWPDWVVIRACEGVASALAHCWALAERARCKAPRPSPSRTIAWSIPSGLRASAASNTACMPAKSSFLIASSSWRVRASLAAKKAVNSRPRACASASFSGESLVRRRMEKSKNKQRGAKPKVGSKKLFFRSRASIIAVSATKNNPRESEPESQKEIAAKLRAKIQKHPRRPCFGGKIPRSRQTKVLHAALGRGTRGVERTVIREVNDKGSPDESRKSP